MVASVRDSDSGDTNFGTSHTIKLPELATGDIVVFAFVGVINTYAAPTPPAGWTALDVAEYTTPTPDMFSWVGYRRITGSEGFAGDGSDTVTFTTGDNTYGSHVSYSIQDAEDPAIEAPSIQGFDNAYTSTPNPPSLTFPAAGNYLCIAIATNNSSATISAWPTGYVDNQVSQRCSYNANAPGLALCTKDVTAASDNPSTFTLTGTAYTQVATIAVLSSSPAKGGGFGAFGL